MVEKNPLLQRCERINVLDVRRATGHGLLDMPQLAGIEVDQAQHPRVDAGAAWRYPAGGMIDRIRRFT
ncbi:hypothetical protein D3C71_2032100 [compost metagenome]